MSQQRQHRYPTRSSSSNNNKTSDAETTLSMEARQSPLPDDTDRRLSSEPDDDSILQQIYYGDSEGSYSGVNALYAAAHRADPSITMKQTRDFLRQQDTYLPLVVESALWSLCVCGAHIRPPTVHGVFRGQANDCAREKPSNVGARPASFEADQHRARRQQLYPAARARWRSSAQLRSTSCMPPV